MRKPGLFAVLPCVAVPILVGVFAFVPVAAAHADTSPSASATTIYHGAPRVRDNSTGTSTNWSGYAVTGATGAFTDVKGSWVVPTATCSSRQTAYSSFWVGIDGYNSSSVEQLGTDSDCSRGTPTYYGWWEMYPNPSMELSTSRYRVQPGDTITAEVSRSGTTYTLKMSSTRGWSFSTTQHGSFSNSSAEWIAEAPSSCSSTCTVLPLANFGTVNFSNSTANGATIGSYGSSVWVDITMQSGSTVKAQPSALNGSGNGFSDTWHHS